MYHLRSYHLYSESCINRFFAGDVDNDIDNDSDDNNYENVICRTCIDYKKGPQIFSNLFQ